MGLILNPAHFLLVLRLITVPCRSELEQLPVQPFLHFAQHAIHVGVVTLQLAAPLPFLCQPDLQLLDDLQVLLDLLVAVAQTLLQLLDHLLLPALSQAALLLPAGDIGGLLFHMVHQLGEGFQLAAQLLTVVVCLRQRVLEIFVGLRKRVVVFLRLGEFVLQLVHLAIAIVQLQLQGVLLQVQVVQS